MDNNYLTSFLGFCDYCLNILYVEKQLSYKCDQCPHFLVCEKCVKFMPTQHPVQHTFIKYKISNKVVGQHYGITCGCCQEVDISGPRYQCQQCDRSYDLCSQCLQHANTKHFQSHTYQLIQDLLVRSNNRLLLARRALQFFARQNSSDNNQREPLTGWTKDDAEKTIQMENQFFQNYQQTKRQLEQIKLEDGKREQEHRRKLYEMESETQRKLSEMQIEASKRDFEMNLESFRESSRILNGRSCSRCGTYCN